jgi:hypothetical protein
MASLCYWQSVLFYKDREQSFGFSTCFNCMITKLRYHQRWNNSCPDCHHRPLSNLATNSSADVLYAWMLPPDPSEQAPSVLQTLESWYVQNGYDHEVVMPYANRPRFPPPPNPSLPLLGFGMSQKFSNGSFRLDPPPAPRSRVEFLVLCREALPCRWGVLGGRGSISTLTGIVASGCSLLTDAGFSAECISTSRCCGRVWVDVKVNAGGVGASCSMDVVWGIVGGGADSVRTGDADLEGWWPMGSSVVLRRRTGEEFLAFFSTSPRSSSLSLTVAPLSEPSSRSVAHRLTFQPSPSPRPRFSLSKKASRSSRASW